MSEKTQVIRLHQQKHWLRELWSDLCTFSVIAGLFAAGYFFESSAMQWFAFIVCFMILFARANAATKKFTPQEAADFISDEYGVRAKDSQ